MTSTLDILDDWQYQEDRILNIYKDAIEFSNYINPPPLMLGQLDKVPATRGMAACYINTHEIFVDFAWATQATDAEIGGCLAHELAHAAAGLSKGHGRTFREIEQEIIDRMRCHGIEVKRAPDQTAATSGRPARAKWSAMDIFLALAPLYAVGAVALVHHAR